jgi:hypothetical protein
MKPLIAVCVLAAAIYAITRQPTTPVAPRRTPYRGYLGHE